MQRIELRSAVTEAVELLLPRVCASCRAYGEVMTQRPGGALCALCDRLLRLATLTVGQAELMATDLPVFSAGWYEHEVARSILAFKDAGRTDLAPYLVSALVRALMGLCEELGLASSAQNLLFVVPLPSSRASVRRRGYEPGPFLARGCVQVVGKGAGVQLLEALTAPGWGASMMRVASGLGSGGLAGKDLFAGGPAQKTLSLADRQQVALRRVVVGQPRWGWLGRVYDLEGRRCILLDDVVTTGASIAAGRAALEQAGAQVLGAVTVARVKRRKAA